MKIHEIKIRIDENSINSNDEAIRQMENDIYKVAQLYYEIIGESKGLLTGNGHHMAQKLCNESKNIWLNHQNKNKNL